MGFLSCLTFIGLKYTVRESRDFLNWHIILCVCVYINLFVLVTSVFVERCLFNVGDV